MILTGTVTLSVLRESCSLPVMHPKHLDDNAHCFVLLVDPVFTGRCVRLHQFTVPDCM